jgi:hypothetical protein
LTKVTISNAIAPVAADIIPGRPPTKAVITAMQNEAYNPTFGSTPAMMEKAMASGISASATTVPASKSPRTLPSQSCFLDKKSMLLLSMQNNSQLFYRQLMNKKFDARSSSKEGKVCGS